MSLYEEIIEAILARLSGTEDEPSEIIDLGIEIGKLEEFRGNHKSVVPEVNTRITVGFYQHMFGTERSATEIVLGKTAQKADIYFMVSIAGRTIYGDNGVYNAIDKVFEYLIGWQYKGHPLAAYSADFLTLDENNAWVYQMLFRFREVPMIGKYEPTFGEDPDEEAYIMKEIDVQAETCIVGLAGSEGENILVPDSETEGDDAILIQQL